MTTAVEIFCPACGYTWDADCYLHEDDVDTLRARVARLEETLQFILNECSWEPTHHESGGDERIGTAARRALEDK